MRVLVACEFSGRVRQAFEDRGHDAWSCDLLDNPTTLKHYKDDVLFHLDSGWDLMIAFPPCTHLCASGARWWKQKRDLQVEAINFVKQLAEADIPRIAIENPVGILSSVWRKPDQKIQPYEFGEDASKTTCLWLKGLEPLRPTQYVEGRIVDGKMRWGNQTDSGQNRLGPSEDRGLIRSITYQGIANAMAEQWGALDREGI